jgi:hypothetical protein
MRRAHTDISGLLTDPVSSTQIPSRKIRTPGLPINKSYLALQNRRIQKPTIGHPQAFFRLILLALARCAGGGDGFKGGCGDTVVRDSVAQVMSCTRLCLRRKTDGMVYVFPVRLSRTESVLFPEEYLGWPMVVGVQVEEQKKDEFLHRSRVSK